MGGPGKKELFEAFGELKPLWQWKKDTRCMVSGGTFYTRIRKGWSVEKALTTKRYLGILLEAFGEKKNLEEWAEDPRFEVHNAPSARRRASGFSLEEALSKPKGSKRSFRRLPSREVWQAFGLELSVVSWSENPLCKVSLPLLKARLKQGMDIE